MELPSSKLLMPKLFFTSLDPIRNQRYFNKRMPSSIICQGKRSGDEVFSDSLPEAFPKFPVHSMVDFNMLEYLLV